LLLVQVRLRLCGWSGNWCSGSWGFTGTRLDSPSSSSSAFAGFVEIAFGEQLGEQPCQGFLNCHKKKLAKKINKHLPKKKGLTPSSTGLPVELLERFEPMVDLKLARTIQWI